MCQDEHSFAGRCLARSPRLTDHLFPELTKARVKCYLHNDAPNNKTLQSPMLSSHLSPAPIHVFLTMYMYNNNGRVSTFILFCTDLVADEVSDSTSRQPLQQPPSNSQCAGPSGSRSNGSNPAAPPGGTNIVNPSTSGSSSSRNSISLSSNVTDTTNTTIPEPEGGDRVVERSPLRRDRDESPITEIENEHEEEVEVPRTRNKGKGRATDPSDAQPPVTTTKKRGRTSGRGRR
jgi:hypothetical protein